jgi:hypothetical protein
LLNQLSRLHSVADAGHGSYILIVNEIELVFIIFDI